LLVLAGSLVVGADVASDEPKGDQEKIQGTFKVVSIEVRGRKIEDEKLRDQKVVFTKDRMLFKAGDKTDGEFAYKLDPTKKPAWLDLAPIDRDGKPMQTALGIYELAGDDLKICHPDPGKDRSTTFVSKPASVLFILRREKS